MRAATAADAAAIARVHVAAWRETYAGLLPERHLRALDVGEKAAFWRDLLGREGAAWCALVAEQPGAGVVGFASGGPNRDPHPALAGELYALYVLRAHQRLGLGRRLVAATAARVHGAGLEGMVAWVLASNGAARRFYEALGGERAGRRRELVGGERHAVVAYAWRDVAALAGAAGIDDGAARNK